MYSLGSHSCTYILCSVKVCTLYQSGTFGLRSVKVQIDFPLSIQNHCAYGFGSHSWMYIVYMCVRMYNVLTGPYVQCTYRFVHILYVNEIHMVNTVNDLF